MSIKLLADIQGQLKSFLSCHFKQMLNNETIGSLWPKKLPRTGKGSKSQRVPDPNYVRLAPRFHSDSYPRIGSRANDSVGKSFRYLKQICIFQQKS